MSYVVAYTWICIYDSYEGKSIPLRGSLMNSKKLYVAAWIMVLSILFVLSGCDALFGATDDEDDVANAAPVANAGSDQELEQGPAVTLDGTGSTGPDGDALTYEWQFTVVPDTSSLGNDDITDADMSTASFVPDVVGVYTIRLTVRDGDRTDTDLVSVTVLESDMSEYMGADSSGNLVILNDSGSVLMLYQGSTPLRYIPDDASDFLVNIPTSSSSTLDLRIYRFSDVESNLASPSSDDIFKRWNVALADSTALSDRSTWYVGSDDSETTSGTLDFSYLAGSSSDISADVYLNSRTGAKILSLAPGVSGRSVGVDYGNYTVLYRYWRSDPSSSSGMEILGWIDEEEVGDTTAPIYAILNSSRELRRFDVPAWNDEGVVENKYATVSIYNDMDIPYKIWIGGDRLIEDVMYTDEPVENRSTIAAGDSADYTLEEGSYILTFKSIDGSETLAEQEIELTASGEVTVRVNDRDDVTVSSAGGVAVDVDSSVPDSISLSIDGPTEAVAAGSSFTVTVSASDADETLPDGATFQWYFNGSAIDGATDASVEVAAPTSAGDHTLSVMVQVGSGLSSERLTVTVD
jgi:hypothetical protein